MQTRILLVAMLAMSMIPSVGQADEGTRYNGGLCQVASDMLIHRDGWAFNADLVTTLTVDCPAVRELDGSANPIVYVIDRHYDEDIGCYASSLTTGEGASPWWGWWTPVVYSWENSSKMQELDLGLIPGDSTSFLYITCAIPPMYKTNASGIFGYSVDEI